MSKDYNFGTSVDALNTIITALDTIKIALSRQRDEHKQALREQHTDGLSDAASLAVNTTPSESALETKA
jgi:hypothetical protein